jgi:hypothetical protein
VTTGGVTGAGSTTMDVVATTGCGSGVVVLGVGSVEATGAGEGVGSTVALGEDTGVGSEVTEGAGVGDAVGSGEATGVGSAEGVGEGEATGVGSGDAVGAGSGEVDVEVAASSARAGVNDRSRNKNPVPRIK